MLRFLALAVPTALLVLGAVDAGLVALGFGPDLAPLAMRAATRLEPLPPLLQTAIVGFEAIALVALFLLVEGRSGSPLVDGLATGIAAWLFAGPFVVAQIALLTRLPVAPFWQEARLSFVSLPAAGLAVGYVAGRQRPPKNSPPPE